VSASSENPEVLLTVQPYKSGARVNGLFFASKKSEKPSEESQAQPNESLTESQSPRPDESSPEVVKPSTKEPEDSTSPPGQEQLFHRQGHLKQSPK